MRNLEKTPKTYDEKLKSHKGKEVTNDPQEKLHLWQKHEGELAATALSDVMNKQTGQQRQAYSREWEQHEMLAGILANSEPVRNMMNTISAIKISDSYKANVSSVVTKDHALDYQMDIMSGSLADRLSFRSAPL